MSRKGSEDLKARVARHFSAPEWFTTFEFPIYGAIPRADGKDRQLDALSVSRIAGKGNEVVAIEVKSDRSDWLRELANGVKSEAWLAVVDRFYVVASKGVVKTEELPSTWGFLEESGSGLKRVVPATLLTKWRADEGRDPMPRELWVRILRRTLEGVGSDARVAAIILEGTLMEGYEIRRIATGRESPWPEILDAIPSLPAEWREYAEDVERMASKRQFGRLSRGMLLWSARSFRSLADDLEPWCLSWSVGPPRPSRRPIAI